MDDEPAISLPAAKNKIVAAVPEVSERPACRRCVCRMFDVCCNVELCPPVPYRAASLSRAYVPVRAICDPWHALDCSFTATCPLFVAVNSSFIGPAGVRGSDRHCSYCLFSLERLPEFWILHLVRLFLPLPQFLALLTAAHIVGRKWISRAQEGCAAATNTDATVGCLRAASRGLCRTTVASRSFHPALWQC